MFTGINPRSPTPLYQQLAESVRRSVSSGELVPGDALPTVRALAVKLRLNPAAVQQAYRELVREGLVVEDAAVTPSVMRIARITGDPALAEAQAADASAAASQAASASPTPSISPSPAAVTTLEPGATVENRFRIRRRIGAGAMGAVYLARDMELDEDVALKVLPPTAFGDETSVRRFINEIRIARRISHRNVVRTHDVGRWAGGLFLTMEFVAGRTLRHELDSRGTLPTAEVARIGLQLVDALAVAHAEGVIHRDVKPQNLVLDDSGTLKVLDFGIAVQEGSSGQLTEQGMVVGTPVYMSPEQLLGDTIGPASDLYATGVVLYECLSGSLPYSATSPVSLAAQIVSSGPAPLADPAGSVPDEMLQVVMALLDRTPSKRPGTPAVAEVLRRFS